MYEPLTIVVLGMMAGTDFAVASPELEADGVALVPFSLTAVTLTLIVSPRLYLKLRLDAVNLDIGIEQVVDSMTC